MANGIIHPVLGVPDYANGYDVTALAVLNGTFTVPSNGYMHFTCLHPADKTSIYCVELTTPNMHIRNFVAYQIGTIESRQSMMVPVAAGDVLNVWNCTNMQWEPTGGTYDFTYYPKFIPCK